MAAQQTVLVVDDDPVILRLLEVNFELEGFRVLTACNGAEGIAAVREHRPDLVVSDVMMPDVNGLELVAALKGDPETASTPIVLLSARAQTGDVRAGLEMGADDYVTKPFEPTDLVERVRRLLDAS